MGPIKKTSQLRPIYLIYVLATQRKMKIAIWLLVVVSKFKGDDSIIRVKKKVELGHKGGAIMVEVLVTTKVSYVTFAARLALTCQTMSLFR
jgi:hypothetical protein